MSQNEKIKRDKQQSNPEASEKITEENGTDSETGNDRFLYTDRSDGENSAEQEGMNHSYDTAFEDEESGSASDYEDYESEDDDQEVFEDEEIEYDDSEAAEPEDDDESYEIEDEYEETVEDAEDDEMYEYEDSDEENGYDEDADEEADETDAEYDYEDDSVISHGPRHRNGRTGKRLGIIAASIAGVLLIAYFGLAFFFNSHFQFNTTINGVDFSLKTAAAVEDYIKQQVGGYTLTLDEINGDQEAIRGTDISLAYKASDEVEKYLDRQNAFAWITSLFGKDEFETGISVSYDEAALESRINSLNCMQPQNQSEPVSAVPVYNGTEFVIQPEVYGTQVDQAKLTESIKSHIAQFNEEVNLKEAGIYAEPRFTSESPELTAAISNMNKYLTASITYDMSPATEVVDRALISQWVTVDGDMNVTFDTEAVVAYINTLGEKYDTVGKTRSITTPTGKVAEVTGGTYGWQIDREAEAEALIAGIQNGEQTTKTPVYAQEAATHAAQDWGNTYVEVDLTTQYMWYIVDGAIVYETAVITGQPTPKRETPQGTYNILEKKRDKTLRGDKKEDGTYEYETPVSFWMRVTWTGIGFHDAVWQYQGFGGELYKTSAGSHGCINMPYSGAETLYNMIFVGCPVVMHY